MSNSPQYVDYPFASHYADIDGVRMHYVDEGPKDADPVVMVHGNPSWSFYFRKMILGLREDRRCIAPDHIGMGLSDKPDDSLYEYTLKTRVDNLEILLDQLDITKNITLILHDWGGMIGSAYAVRHPERVKRLIILNTAAFRLPVNTPLPWQLKLARTPVIGEILVQGLNVFSIGAVKKMRYPKTHVSRSKKRISDTL